jgi:hypothetical protein
VAELSGSETQARTVMAAIQRGIILVLVGVGVSWSGVKIQSTAEIATVGVLLLCVGVGHASAEPEAIWPLTYTNSDTSQAFLVF